MSENKRTGCSCKACTECCKREPGWFLPEEIKTAARFFDLSEREFLKKYCEEHIEDNILCFSPKQKDGKPECIFLNKKGLCDIHKVKPYECKKVFGCQHPHRHTRIREIIKKKWK